jgi:multicomponent K+:H+ antiporter subunit G
MMGEALVAALIYIGAFFTLVGSLGLARLPDFYARLHGPTKATTLGVGSLLLASMLFFVVVGDGLRLHKFLITVFLFLTAPVSGHLLAKAGLRLRVPTNTIRPADPMGHLQEEPVATKGEEVRRS